MARAYTTYNPLRVFVGLGLAILFLGALPIIRFLLLYMLGEGDGHIQSLVIGGALLMLGAMVAVMGVLADLISANRKLMEVSIERIRQIEDRLERIERTEEHTSELQSIMRTS